MKTIFKLVNQQELRIIEPDRLEAEYDHVKHTFGFVCTSGGLQTKFKISRKELEELLLEVREIEAREASIKVFEHP